MVGTEVLEPSLLSAIVGSSSQMPELRMEARRSCVGGEHFNTTPDTNSFNVLNSPDLSCSFAFFFFLQMFEACSVRSHP